MTKKLKEIVGRFNTDFDAWMKETGCVANFSWGYDRETGRKFLQMNEIDMMIYRSAPPSNADVRAALDRVGQENQEK